MNLSGVFPPLCTPFYPDGSLALPQLKKNIERYNRTSVTGYVVTGSTGEAVMLGESEKVQVWEAVRVASAPGKLLIAGTGAQSTLETISLTKAAAGLGYDAALVQTPFIFKAQMMKPEAQIDFFSAVADAARIPVLFYSFPQLTGIDLDPDVMARIVGHPNIVGLKESSPDLKKIEKLLVLLPANFPLLVGASPLFEQCLELGAVGGILAVANPLPKAACEMYECCCAGDLEGSKAAQQRILEAASVAPRYGIQGLKYGMDQMGYYGGACRRPLLPLDEQQKSVVEAVFRDMDE